MQEGWCCSCALLGVGVLAAGSVTPGEAALGLCAASAGQWGQCSGSSEPWAVPSTGWQPVLAAAPVSVPCTRVTSGCSGSSVLQTPSFFLPSGSVKGWQLGVSPPSAKDLRSAVSSSHSCSG